MDFLPHILILNPEYLLSSLWVPVFSTTYLLPRGSQYLFTLHQMIGWENNRDCDITTPLSLETIEVQIKGANKIRGLERCRSTAPKSGTAPTRWVTIYFRDQRGAASFRYRNCAEITFVMYELKSYQIWFSCRHKS